VAANDVYAEVPPATDLVLMRRVKIRSGVNRVVMTQAAVQSITYQVFQGSTQVGANGTAVVADTVYNTLQTGSLWTVDNEGFNFALALAGTYLPDANATYAVQVRVTLTGGTAFYLPRFVLTTTRFEKAVP
jgi:hypothetical protein